MDFRHQIFCLLNLILLCVFFVFLFVYLRKGLSLVCCFNNRVVNLFINGRFSLKGDADCSAHIRGVEGVKSEIDFHFLRLWLVIVESIVQPLRHLHQLSLGLVLHLVPEVVGHFLSLLKSLRNFCFRSIFILILLFLFFVLFLIFPFFLLLFVGFFHHYLFSLILDKLLLDESIKYSGGERLLSYICDVTIHLDVEALEIKSILFFEFIDLDA